MVKTISNTSLRGLRQHERLEKLRQAKPPGVRVVPTSDAFRRLMKHPTAGGFGKEGGKEWPNDRFTKKRILEGAIKLESEHKPEHAPPRRKHHEDTSNNAA